MEDNLKEKIDKVMLGGLMMAKSEGGYRHAIDPFLLCDFAEIRYQESVADLGTATGIIPLLLSAMMPAGKITGIEIQAQLAARAEQNVELNNLQSQIKIINSDVREMFENEALLQESCDVVVSNPPYRKIGTGKVAPDKERAACRHEINGDIRDFLDAAFYLLRNKGRCYLIYLPDRLPELLSLMRELKLEPKRMKCVHSKPGSQAVMVLVEGRKNGKPGMSIEPPLYIYDGDNYSAEVEKIFQMDE